MHAYCNGWIAVSLVSAKLGDKRIDGCENRDPLIRGAVRLCPGGRGYLALVADLVARRTMALWRRLLSSPVLTLNGWVAFNLPRAVTALGGALLTGLVAVHIYMLAVVPDLPQYFTAYVLVLTAACLVAASSMLVGIKPAVPQAGWYLGSLVCSVFLAVYLLTRWVGLPGLATVTGRWDLAPGTLGMACAAAFIAVHTTVLSGINVAYPRRQQWYD